MNECVLCVFIHECICIAPYMNRIILTKHAGGNTGIAVLYTRAPTLPSCREARARVAVVQHLLAPVYE